MMIYGLCDPLSGALRYIGKSKHPRKRLTEHVNLRNRKYHNACWVKSLYNKGLRPEIFVIEEVGTDGSEEESFYIAYFRSIGCDLTNQTAGGEGGALSAEARKKISDSKRGKTIPPDVRAKMRASALGRRMSPEAVAKTAAAHRGKTVSEQTKAKLRARTVTAEHRRLISEKAKGNKRWLGKKHSEASKEKNRRTQRANHLFRTLVRTAASAVIVGAVTAK